MNNVGDFMRYLVVAILVVACWFSILEILRVQY